MTEFPQPPSGYYTGMFLFFMISVSTHIAALI